MNVWIDEDELYPFYLETKVDNGTCIFMTEQELAAWKSTVKQLNKWQDIIRKRMEESEQT